MLVAASRPDQADEPIGLTELRANLGRYVDQVDHHKKVLLVGRNGRGVAVMISAAEYQRLTETDPAAVLPGQASSAA